MNWLYELLSQIGYHHPLHPPAIHIPMGLIIGGFHFCTCFQGIQPGYLCPDRAALYCFGPDGRTRGDLAGPDGLAAFL